MDLSTALRDIVRQRYPALRRSLTALEEDVINRYWGEGALVRVTFGRFLTSLDECADRLVAEGAPGEPSEPPAPEEPRAPEEPATPAASDMPATPDASAAPEQPSTLSTPDTPVTPEKPAAPEASTASDEPSTPDTPDTPITPDIPSTPVMPDTSYASDMPNEPTAEPEPVGTIDVAFTLPAEVEAGTVALCGEFNDWSTNDILLEREPDRTWRTTVALEPGRSYRYRYLLDGERWENGPQADDYLPNPYGTVDSVVVVRPT